MPVDDATDLGSWDCESYQMIALQKHIGKS